MADGLGFSEGSGSLVSTDDAGALGHVQIIKLAISADGSATVIPADAANGLDVDVTRLPALVAGTAYVGKTRLTDGTTDAEVIPLTGYNAQAVGLVDIDGDHLSFAAPAVLSVDVTTSAVTYPAGDVIGGVLSFATAAASGGTGHVLAVRFYDYDDLTHDGTNGAYRLDLYSATPTGAGIANDAAYAVASDAEAATYLCSIYSTDGAWVDVGPAKVCTVASPGPWAYSCAVTTLFGVLVAVTLDSGASSAGTGRKVALHVVKD